MKKVTGHNVKDIDPGDLVNGLGVAFSITEKALPGLISILSRIVEGIQNGPRARRIKALEEAAKLNVQINHQQQLELEALKQEIEKLKTKQ